MMKRILFFLLMGSHLFSKADAVVKLSVEPTAVLPEQIYLRSYLYKNRVDTIHINTTGVFVIPYKNFELSTLCRLQAEHAVFEFMLNPKEEKVLIQIRLNQRENNDMIIENSPENDAYKELNEITGFYDGKMALLKAETTASDFKNLADAYNRSLDSIAQEYPFTFTVSVLVRLKTIPLTQPNGLFQSYINSYFYGAFSADSGLVTTPFFAQMLNRYVKDLSAKAKKPFDRMDDFLDSLYRKNSFAYKEVCGYLYNNLFLLAKEEGMQKFLAYQQAKHFEYLPIGLQQQLQKLMKVMPGNEILEIPLTGNEPFYKLVAQSRYTIVIVWSSDCPHCQEVLPRLKNLYEQYQSKGLNVIGFTLDDDATRWTYFIKEQALPWQNELADAQSKPIIQELLPVYTPTLVLVDNNRIIQNRLITYEELEERINLLLK